MSVINYVSFTINVDNQTSNYLTLNDFTMDGPWAQVAAYVTNNVALIAPGSNLQLVSASNVLSGNLSAVLTYNVTESTLLTIPYSMDGTAMTCLPGFNIGTGYTVGNSSVSSESQTQDGEIIYNYYTYTFDVTVTSVT